MDYRRAGEQLALAWVSLIGWERDTNCPCPIRRIIKIFLPLRIYTSSEKTLFMHIFEHVFTPHIKGITMSQAEDRDFEFDLYIPSIVRLDNPASPVRIPTVAQKHQNMYQ
jgi:hypothetical protein